jgi:hypothetical protein
MRSPTFSGHGSNSGPLPVGIPTERATSFAESETMKYISATGNSLYVFVMI